uniref:Uncharacterized protein n=1 Tax=Anguilla anguilla TaxID=7936 RepID=A0A0E9UM81_ANGAN
MQARQSSQLNLLYFICESKHLELKKKNLINISQILYFYI